MILVATPDAAEGSITVSLTEVPGGYETATITRTLDGVQTTLADRANVIGGRVDVVDYAAPPGWPISYAATAFSSAGANLALNPSLESGDVSWGSSGATRTIRSDGSAHTGANYLRANASAAGAVSANVSVVNPSVVTASDFPSKDTASASSIVTDTEASYVRTVATSATSTVSVQYGTYLTIAAGQQLYARAIYRTKTLGAPLSAFVRILVRYYDANSVTTGSLAVGNGALTNAWTAVQGALPAGAPANSVKCRLIVELLHGAGDFDFSINDTLDVAFFQCWVGATTLPTTFARVEQQPATAAGKIHSAEAYVRQGTVAPAAYYRMDLAFYDASGTQIGNVAFGTAAALRAQWDLAKSAQVAAPVGTASVRAMLRAQSNSAGGNPNPGETFDIDDLFITNNSAATLAVDPVIATLPARFTGDAWLKDPSAPGKALNVMVKGLPSLSRAGNLGLHHVVGRARPVAVTDVRSAEAGELSLITTDASELDRLIDLLSPGSVLLFQTTPAALLPAEMYLVVSDATEERVSPIVNDAWRIHVLSFTVVDAPGEAVVTHANTYGELLTYGVSYTNVLAGRASYLDVLTTTFNPSPGGSPSVVRV